jgi:hypothetical protein
VSTPSNPRSQASAAQKGPACADCYFRRNGLCALSVERPCPTFRASTRALEPPRQPRLIARPIPAAAY